MEDYIRRFFRRIAIVHRTNHDAFTLPENVFKTYFRISKRVAYILCEELRSELEPQATQRTVISVELKVLCALRFFACGSYQQSVANEYCLKVSQPTASRAITQVCNAANKKLLRKWTVFPTDEREIQTIKRQFMELSGFPHSSWSN